MSCLIVAATFLKSRLICIFWDECRQILPEQGRLLLVSNSTGHIESFSWLILYLQILIPMPVNHRKGHADQMLLLSLSNSRGFCLWPNVPPLQTCKMSPWLTHHRRTNTSASHSTAMASILSRWRDFFGVGVTLRSSPQAYTLCDVTVCSVKLQNTRSWSAHLVGFSHQGAFLLMKFIWMRHQAGDTIKKQTKKKNRSWDSLNHVWTSSVKIKLSSSYLDKSGNCAPFFSP